MYTGQRLLTVSWAPQDKETQIIGFLTTTLALTGILIPQVQWSSLLIVVFVTILGMIVLDNLKQWFVHKTHTNI